MNRYEKKMYSDETRENNRSVKQSNSLECNGYASSQLITDKDRMATNGDINNKEWEFCFLRMNYRRSAVIKQIDEIKILQHNQTVFQGCLQDGDSFTFKSRRDPNESMCKFDLYLNDLFEVQFVSCCEYGLMRENQQNLLKIEEILGSNPCEKCETFATTSKNEVLVSSFSAELRDSLPLVTDWSEVKEKPMLGRVVSLRQDSIAIDETTSNEVPEESPKKRVYGPPQLSQMLSFNEYSDPIAPLSSVNPLETLDNDFNETSNQNPTAQTSTIESTVNDTENEQRLENTADSETERSLPDDMFQAISNLLYNMFIHDGQPEQRTPSDSGGRVKGDVEWFNLIFLTTSPPDELEIQKLRRFINTIDIIDDSDDCIAKINGLTNRKLILILSEDFSDSFLPRIENVVHILSIYILTSKKSNDEIPLSYEQNSKVRAACSDVEEFFPSLSRDTNPAYSDLLIFQPAYESDHSLDVDFLFFQLLGEILLDRNEMENALPELIDFAREQYEGNQYELEQIDDFEKNYRKETAMSWFSRHNFLMKILYRAILLNEVDILYKMRAFVQDVSFHIEQETNPEPTSVYLGFTVQRSSLDVIDAMRYGHNLTSLNQLSFGSISEEKAVAKAKSLPRLSDDFLCLVVRIDFPADNRCYMRNFRMKDNDEIDVFIPAGIKIKIKSIDKDSRERDYAVLHLEFVSFEEEKTGLEEIQRKRAEIESPSPLFRLIRLLLKVQLQLTAERFLTDLVNDESFAENIKRQAALSQGLELTALVHYHRENFQRASELFLLALKAYRRFLPINDSTLCQTYCDIGTSFYNLNQFQSAEEFYQLALDTQLRAINPNLISAVKCCNLLGVNFFKQGNVEKALQFLNRAERILQRSGDRHLAEMILVFGNIADIFHMQKKLDEALVYYKKVAELHLENEPRNPKELYAAHFVIAEIYLSKENYAEAASFYEQATNVAKEFLPEKHSRFVLLNNNIGFCYYQQEQYSTAINRYSQGLSMAAESLLENDPLIGTLYSNMALVYSKLGRYDEAVETMEKSIAQYLKTVSEDDERVVHKRTLLEGFRNQRILHEILDENSVFF